MIESVDWDDLWMTQAYNVARKSKDIQTHVGAVIVSPDNSKTIVGWNSFPRGIDDNIPERQERPEKYKWFEHAESNAFDNAARTGMATGGCRIYVTMFPCCSCSGRIIQNGITEVIVHDLFGLGWDNDMTDEQKVGKIKLLEANIPIRWYDGPIANNLYAYIKGKRIDFPKIS